MKIERNRLVLQGKFRSGKILVAGDAKSSAAFDLAYASRIGIFGKFRYGKIDVAGDAKSPPPDQAHS